MKLVNIDLTNIVAIGHEDDHLALLIDRNGEMEYLEISAPFAAYEGLQELAEIVDDDDYDDYNYDDDDEISMLPVESTMASAMGYDEEQQILQIQFNSGSVYQYSEVEIETWKRLQVCDSKGRFFHQEIRGHYSSHRLDDISETYS